MLISYLSKHSLIRALLVGVAILTLTSGTLFAQIETADIIPAALSDSDKITLSKEKAKLDELRKALLDDIAQQNTECGQVAESNTFQVDLCRNRQSFLMSQIQNYKTRLKEYRDKIQKALFMAPQGKSSVQSGLVFKDIPPPPVPKNPAADLEIDKDAPNEPILKGTEPGAPQITADTQKLIDYVNNPENHPRVKRAKEEADQSHTLHVATSKVMLDEVNRTMADVRAKTVAKNPRLGREEVDRIVSQDPEVRRKAAMWYLIHNQTREHSQDLEEDYEHISKETAKELDGKRGIK